MRRLAFLAAMLGASALRATEAAPPSPSAPDTAPEFPLSAYSSFGASLAKSGHFGELGWTDTQIDAFLDGFRQAAQGKEVPVDGAARQLAAEMGRRIGAIASSAPQAAGTAPDHKAQLARYFKDMQKRLGLQVSDSGLGYNVTPGRNGIRPRPGDVIVFTCEAAGADGTTKLPQLSSEHVRVKFEGMLPGLMEGLQMMTVDSHAVFVIPPALTFGDGPWPEGVPRGSPLVFSITLNDVIAAGAQP